MFSSIDVSFDVFICKSNKQMIFFDQKFILMTFSLNTITTNRWIEKDFNPIS